MDKKFIFFLITFTFILLNNSLSENNINLEDDKGIIALMYHRFDETKYPSTNIQMDIFKKQLNIIENKNLNYIDPKDLKKKLLLFNNQKKILLTIDDGFSSFYNHAWPILKKRKIPFILFVSTEAVGKSGYMNWSQILEIHNSGLGLIGNHSHTHDYLVDKKDEEIINDIKKSMGLFEKNLKFSPKIFSYPFGEYSNNFKKIVKNLGFEIAFGQHSGVIDPSKNLIELPRFPINEKYGDLKRFESILKLLPFPYKEIRPTNRYLTINENPPKIQISFFKEQKNLKNITCYSNEGNLWRQSDISIDDQKILKINIAEKFSTERGRINCSLNDKLGWRWLGIQYVIAEY